MASRSSWGLCAQVAFSGRGEVGSISASCHFMARAWRIGAIRRMTSPFGKRRTVPVDRFTTTASAVVTLVIAAAVQRGLARNPRHFSGSGGIA